MYTASTRSLSKISMGETCSVGQRIMLWKYERFVYYISKICVDNNIVHISKCIPPHTSTYTHFKHKEMIRMHGNISEDLCIYINSIYAYKVMRILKCPVTAALDCWHRAAPMGLPLLRLRALQVCVIVETCYPSNQICPYPLVEFHMVECKTFSWSFRAEHPSALCFHIFHQWFKLICMYVLDLCFGFCVQEKLSLLIKKRVLNCGWKLAVDSWRGKRLTEINITQGHRVCDPARWLPCALPRLAWLHASTASSEQMRK